MGDGKACAQTLLAYGADVIMPVAGPQTIDTVQEIKNQKSNCIVVGVDTPQEESDMNDNSVYTDKADDNKIIKFSAQKNIVGITEQILDLAYSESPYYELTGAT
jgi:basic membrane lipoprotein Med (substrate-binding protein (PBP1-ABC) superfamily)